MQDEDNYDQWIEWKANNLQYEDLDPDGLRTLDGLDCLTIFDCTEDDEMIEPILELVGEACGQDPSTYPQEAKDAIMAAIWALPLDNREDIAADLWRRIRYPKEDAMGDAIAYLRALTPEDIQALPPYTSKAVRGYLEQLEQEKSIPKRI